jgi:hypothetical protein
MENNMNTMDTQHDTATQLVYEQAYEMLKAKLLPEYEAAHDENVRDQAEHTLGDAMNNTWHEDLTLAEWEQRVRTRLGC